MLQCGEVIRQQFVSDMPVVTLSFSVVVTYDADTVYDVHQGELVTMRLVRGGSYLPHFCFNYIATFIMHIDVVDKRCFHMGTLYPR